MLKNIKNDLLYLPELENELQEIIGRELKAKNLNREEFDVAKKSKYYRHVKFKEIEKYLED